MYKILVVDDEKKIRETLRDYLEAGGIKTILAENGSEACQKAFSERFDLILMDVMMPKMNGIEALKEIRSYSDVPVLFLSALGEERGHTLLHLYSPLLRAHLRRSASGSIHGQRG